MAATAGEFVVLALAVAGVLMISLCFVSSSLAMLPRVVLEHPPTAADGSLSLLVVGDWGRRGLYNQSEVATQMGRIGEELGIDFVISTGDNFYEDGLTGVDDGAFRDSFTNVYTAKSLQKPWYSVLGNHDYRGDVIAQLSPHLKNIDSRWVCMRSFVLDAELVQFFMVDTTPFVRHYWTRPKEHHYDWREVAPRDQYLADLLEGTPTSWDHNMLRELVFGSTKNYLGLLLSVYSYYLHPMKPYELRVEKSIIIEKYQELDLALETSTAQWKFVVGHHTMRSVSDHADTDELLELLLPVLKARNVDMYINGHDHCLEHISSRDSPVQFVTSGGGSKAWRGVHRPTSDKLRFFYDGQGFASLQVTGARLEVVFYDVHGNALYRWSTTKQLQYHPSL